MTVYQEITNDQAMEGNASVGDIVTINLKLTPENGYVPESLFDTKGEISFVLGWGNYLPGVHELLSGMSKGSAAQNVSLDGGWGERNADLIIEVPKTNLKKMKSIDTIKEGATLNLQGGIQVSVVRVTDNTIIVDANPPLAGSSYSCSLDVLNVDRFPTSKLQNKSSTGHTTCSDTPFEVATFAMGCFWGGELAFMRVPGVVGTKVGYTQGATKNPTYETVCQGDSKHREAILVVYDSRVVSYEELVELFMARLKITSSQYKLNIFEEDEEASDQYRNGLYYHNAEQMRIAEEAILSNNNIYDVELKEASVIYDAEEHHQQYLLKGGQSARKGAKETIRCFG